MSKIASVSAPMTSEYSAIRRLVADTFAGIREGRAIAVRYHTLARLSESELASRGLTRRDVPHAALADASAEMPPNYD